MKTVSLILCMLFVGTFVEADGLTSRIIGGKNAIDGQFPYQVSLQRRIIINIHFCGASIISTRFLLTAAHCTVGNNSNPQLVVAVIGSVNRTSGVTVKLDKITPHQDWDRYELVNDISLIRTAEQIVFSRTIQPIALPTQDLKDEDDIALVVSGWGYNSTCIKQSPEILQFIETHAISLGNCRERYRDLDERLEHFVREENVCTINKKNVGACEGDSGGPLVYNSGSNTKLLVGIASWVAPNCAKGYPDVFTRVYSYIDWIQQQMELQSI